MHMYAYVYMYMYMYHLILSACIALLIPSLFGTKEVAGPANEMVRVVAMRRSSCLSCSRTSMSCVQISVSAVSTFCQLRSSPDADC